MTVAGPARYATPEEAARLREQALVNFQREKERQGMLATRGGDPAPQLRETRQPAFIPMDTAEPEASPSPTRRSVSAAEARYAMQIGKSPFELTAAERAVARGN